MAPITRSSVRAPPSVTREGSWQFTADQNDSEPEAHSSEVESEDGDPFFDEIEDPSMASPTRRLSARHDLSRLEETSSRVKKQVDEYARDLDKFIAANKDASSERIWDDAHALLKSFQKNATTRAEDASKSKSPRSTSRDRSHRISISSIEASDPVLKRQEADIWEILATLMAIDSPEHRRKVHEAQSDTFHKMNQYSSSLERWEAFVETDIFAQETLAIIAWLQRTANSSATSIDELTKELRGRSERGEGIWTSGWIYTKEKIKGEKRLRSWSQYIEPKERHNVRINRPDGAAVATQLDPDATLRQHQTLFEEDVFHEAAAWLTCWEMIRRGRPWTEVKEYWDQRNEHWRACSILGLPVPASDNDTDESLSWIRACGSEEPWSMAARLLSDDPRIDKFESAVYGLLSNNKNRSLQVCETADDQFFVTFVSMLQDRYEHFCRNITHRVQYHSNIAQSSANYDQIQALLKNLLSQGKLKHDGQDLFKAIQASIITKTLPPFLANLGRSIAVDHMHSNQEKGGKGSTMDTETQEALRTAVHIQIIMDRLGYMKSASAEEYGAMQQNTSAYVRHLREVGLLNLAPLYASCMPPSLAARTLGENLITLTNEQERHLLVQLMGSNGIHFINVLQQMLHTTSRDQQDVKPFQPVNVVVDNPAKPRKLRIRADFMDQDITSNEIDLVHCLEWFRYADESDWELCCTYVTNFLAKFVNDGRLSAALALVQDASLQELSRSIIKTDLTLGESSPETSDNEPPPGSRAVNGRSKAQSGLDGLADQIARKKQAQTWQDLEQLVLTLGSLQQWANLAMQADPEIHGPRALTDRRHAVRKLLALIDAQCQILLDPEFLAQPPTPALAPVLSAIRTHYLPSILLGWLSALEFAGHSLSRDYLGEAMNVAVLIASTEGVAETVQQSGKMGLIVDQLAVVSRSVLEANEQSGGKKKKTVGGVDLGIWNVEPAEVGLEGEMGGFE
ncbi:MAG: hypothetical protein Q9227_007178 [Pyrenula ochraceoflavens]